MKIVKLTAVLGAVLLGGLVLTGCDTSVEEPAVPPPEEALPVAAGEGKVLILQVYGSGEAAENDGNISHSFVELYNPTETPVSLAGCSIQYRSDYSGSGVTADAAWSKLDLDGVIPAGASYLILGKKVNAAAEMGAGVYFPGPNLTLDADESDTVWPGKVFSNQGFKVVLLSDTGLLSADVPNPFNTIGGKAYGYIDMIGVKNGRNVALTGYEGETVPDGENGAYQFISKQKSARRNSLTDTDDNNADFTSLSWQPATMPRVLKEFYRPKNTGGGAWDPMAVPEVPNVPADHLFILQAYGNKGKTDAAVSHSFVELYNPTGGAINLSGYSLQYSEGGTAWEKLDLTGTIPAGGSWLVRGKTAAGAGGTTGPAMGLDLGAVTPDQEWDLGLSAVQFKLCLMHSTELLTAANPFTAAAGRPLAKYVDMIGSFDNDAEALSSFSAIIDGYEGDIPPNLLSKQKSVRRKSLADHDENAYDFAAFDYRDKDIASGGNTDADRAKFAPRTGSNGTYTPQF